MDGHPHLRGPGPTKTLAKLCNHVAKDSERKPGSYPAELQRVCNWAELSEQQRTDILGRTPAGEIWGVGRRISAQLAEQGVLTALDLARLPAHAARDGWSVVLERTVRELQGVSCMSLETAPAAKKQIACTAASATPSPPCPTD
jgi:DNA polymerase V